MCCYCFQTQKGMVVLCLVTFLMEAYSICLTYKLFFKDIDALVKLAAALFAYVPLTIVFYSYSWLLNQESLTATNKLVSALLMQIFLNVAQGSFEIYSIYHVCDQEINDDEVAMSDYCSSMND